MSDQICNHVTFQVNATAVLIDSNIHPKHGVEPDKGGIFTFQQNLAALFAFVTPAKSDRHPFYVIQYDGEQGW